MSPTSGTAILLTDRANEDEIGVIEFHPNGHLLFRVLDKGLHVYALKSVEQILKENGLEEPLYKKYAQMLETQKELSLETLEKEARFYAGILNNLTPPLVIGGKSIEATTAHFSRRDPEAAE